MDCYLIISTMHLLMYLYVQAEERLKMIEEQMKIENEKQKLKKKEEKAAKKEQAAILGKDKSRQKLTFSLNKPL